MNILGFGQRPAPVQLSDADRAYEAGRQQFADLCAAFVGDSWRAARRRTQALAEYDTLCKNPQIASIAAVNDGETKILYVGTEVIVLRKRAAQQHEHAYEIGQMIVAIMPRGFECHNITRKVDGHPHPHVSQNGTLCVSDGKEEIMMDIADGRLADAAAKIVYALHILDEHPYKDVAYWPLAGHKEEAEDLHD